MDDKGIPKELFEKDPRIKPVGPKNEGEESQALVEPEVKFSEGASEKEADETIERKNQAEFTEISEWKTEKQGEIEKEIERSEEAPVVEVEESLEKITSLPTIEASPVQTKPSQPPRYFEFEEEDGQLVKKENVYEPQSYIIPGAEGLEETKSTSVSPLIWLAVVIFLLVMVFLIYRFAF